MTETRHPDLEIYVKNRTPEEIQQWLAQHASVVETQSSKNGIHQIDVTFPGGTVGVMIHEKVAGKAWNSVWFKNNQTPWNRDLDCAHAAASEMATQIRCIASGWQDGDDPDEWWKVENGVQEQIQWRT